MANKFTKSVLERQAKEERAIEVAEPENSSAAIPRKEAEIAAPQTIEPAFELKAYIDPNSQRNAKNKTFYLDAAVIEAVHRAAAAQKTTDSKLVNGILKKVLGIP